MKFLKYVMSAAIAISLTACGGGGGSPGASSGSAGNVPLSISPSTASTYVGTVVDVVVTGGTPPYRVGGGIPIAASVVQDPNNENKFKVTAKAISDGLDISILDSLDSSAKFELTVIQGEPIIRLSPSVLTVSELDLRPIIFTVFGATGNVTAYSTDLAQFSAVVADVRNADGTTTVTVTPVTRCLGGGGVGITVVDETTAQATATISVVKSVVSCS